MTADVSDVCLDVPFSWVLKDLLALEATEELMSQRLGGLHAFMPLLQLPWPQQEPLRGHLGSTLATAAARRGAAKVLQVALDSELGRL